MKNITACGYCLLMLTISIGINFACRKDKDRALRWIIPWIGIIFAARACLDYICGLIYPTSHWEGFLILVILVIGFGVCRIWYCFYGEEEHNWGPQDLPFLIVAGVIFFFMFIDLAGSNNGSGLITISINGTVIFYPIIYFATFIAGIINIIFYSSIFSRIILCISGALFAMEAILLTIAKEGAFTLFMIFALAAVVFSFFPLPAEQRP